MFVVLDGESALMMVRTHVMRGEHGLVGQGRWRGGRIHDGRPSMQVTPAVVRGLINGQVWLGRVAG